MKCWKKIKMFFAKFRPDVTTPAPRPQADRQAATLAVQNAQRGLVHARGQALQAHALAGGMRLLREQNHFGESVEMALRKK